MSSNLIDENSNLNKTYNTNITRLKNYYNLTTNAILRSRLSANQKNSEIEKLKAFYKKQMIAFQAEFNNGLEQLKQKYKINKKALLIGCNYRGTDNELIGCINDVSNIQKMLKTSYGFTNPCVITDDTAKLPTRENILNAFKSLLMAGQSGDTLFFLFSGHGGNTIDKNSEELDGLDEVIYPLDLNYIVDDELKALIQTHLKKDVTLFALFDSCHSGTMMDLKYQHLNSDKSNNNTENNKNLETLGNVIMISGCMDSQKSADAPINLSHQGAMTWSFLDAIKSNPNITWNDLVLNMRSTLSKSFFSQTPQLSSGKPLDLNSKICLA
jgi:hypothetical protein